MYQNVRIVNMKDHPKFHQMDRITNFRVGQKPKTKFGS